MPAVSYPLPTKRECTIGTHKYKSRKYMAHLGKPSSYILKN